MKQYTIEIFKETLKKIIFLYYLKYTYINAAYLGSLNKLRAIDSVYTDQKIRVKANS